MSTMRDANDGATAGIWSRDSRRPTWSCRQTSDRDEQADSAARRGGDKSVRIGATRLGKGLFARRRYPAEAVIGEIAGQVIDDPYYGSDYCMNIGDGRVLEPASPFRYLNHRCEPNCEFDFFDLQDAGITPTRRRVFLIALREIKPGEELTIAYNWPASFAIPCRCRAPSCRGWIVDPAQWDALMARLAAQDIG
jgi:uncharacterized protein